MSKLGWRGIKSWLTGTNWFGVVSSWFNHCRIGTITTAVSNDWFKPLTKAKLTIPPISSFQWNGRRRPADVESAQELSTLWSYQLLSLFNIITIINSINITIIDIITIVTIVNIWIFWSPLSTSSSLSPINRLSYSEPNLLKSNEHFFSVLPVFNCSSSWNNWIFLNMLESFEVLLLAVSCSLKGSEEMLYEQALSVFSSQYWWNCVKKEGLWGGVLWTGVQCFSQHKNYGIGSRKDGRF